jgi:hypothetical protein
MNPFRFKDDVVGAVGHWYMDKICLSGYNVTAEKIHVPNKTNGEMKICSDRQAFLHGERNTTLAGNRNVIGLAPGQP